jgi:hypothetical protein
MTADERFERIERNLLDLTTAMQGLVALADSNQKALAGLVISVTSFIDSSHAYVQSSNARMAELERNLDTLIRAITMEHQNGKGNEK